MSLKKILYSGKIVDLMALTPTDISLPDISRALSNLARFDGATEDVYSVAQHSVYVADLAHHYDATPAMRFAALMHDAAEAYVGDLNSPMKSHCPNFKIIENKVHAVIMTAFGFTPPPLIDEYVKTLDMIALTSEFRDLFGITPEDKRFSELDYPAIKYWHPTPTVKPVFPAAAYCDFTEAVERLALLNDLAIPY
ncbi:MAG: phosphohydrolase [Rhodobiaceae bacterium]|nr:MAG: phosphohydrolase [Rhodobiaceae bacterium]